jgi:hypothetical protein
MDDEGNTMTAPRAPETSASTLPNSDVGARPSNAPSFAEWKKSRGIGSLLIQPDYQGVTSRAGATVGQAFNAERQNLNRNMAAMGVDPRAGRYQAARRDFGLQEAAAKAGAQNAAWTNEQRYADTTNFNRKAAISGAQQVQMNNSMQGLSSAAGGLSNLAAQQANAAAQNNAGIGSLIGTLGAAGIMAMNPAAAPAVAPALSDRRLKENIEQVGRDEQTNLPLYTFNYKGDTRRYEGVMADEVAVDFPEAVVIGEDGYARVRYDLLGIQMKEVQ